MLGGSDAERKVKTLDGSESWGLQGAWGVRGVNMQHKVSLSCFIRYSNRIQ